MAIIKNGRINIWNAVKKQFEVVHPETETARITDFADGIVQKLALTSAMTAVTALQTDSWFGKLLKMALTASGVRYNIADNGYICFGSLFGGLILQWIKQDPGMLAVSTSKVINIVFPINLTTIHAALTARTNPISGDWSGVTACLSIGDSTSALSLAIFNRGSVASSSNFYILIIGR